jgi:hypothetical protein
MDGVEAELLVLSLSSLVTGSGKLYLLELNGVKAPSNPPKLDQWYDYSWSDPRSLPSACSLRKGVIMGFPLFYSTAFWKVSPCRHG